MRQRLDNNNLESVQDTQEEPVVSANTRRVRVNTRGFKGSIRGRIVAIAVMAVIIVVLFVGIQIGGGVAKFFDDIANGLKGKHVESSSTTLLDSITLDKFDIVTLYYKYHMAVVESDRDTERHFWFIRLKDGVRTYIVEYDGEIQIGMDGNDIKFKEKYDGSKKILEVTIPSQKVIHHSLPIESFDVKFEYDNEKMSEDQSKGEFLSQLKSRVVDVKKDITEKIISEKLFERAQETAENDVRQLLENIPGFTDEYDLEFKRETPAYDMISIAASYEKR